MLSPESGRGGGGEGGPDPAFPLLFHKNPASHTFFITFPNLIFVSEKKYIKKSNFLQKGNSFLYLSMMKEHDMVIVTSGFYSRPLLLEISANPVKVSTIPVLHKVEQVVVFIAASRNIEFPFLDRRGSGARTRSIIGGHSIKRDETSCCSRDGITIYHI